MNPPKFNIEDYINFIVGSPKIFSCSEAAKVQIGKEKAPSMMQSTEFCIEPSHRHLLLERRH